MCTTYLILSLTFVYGLDLMVWILDHTPAQRHWKWHRIRYSDGECHRQGQSHTELQTRSQAEADPTLARVPAPLRGQLSSTAWCFQAWPSPGRPPAWAHPCCSPCFQPPIFPQPPWIPPPPALHRRHPPVQRPPLSLSHVRSGVFWRWRHGVDSYWNARNGVPCF